MPTRETEAADSLRNKDVVDPTPSPEVVEEEKVESKTRPRRFKWVDDRHLTVENWLSGTAYADVEVFPGVVFRFVEASNSSLRDADAIVNSMGPKFMLRGLEQHDGSREDIARHDQWARARNVAMLAVTVTRMGGESWPPGESLSEKFGALDKMGHIKIDRLIQAMSEFISELALMIESADLGNS